jgi:hypothetical protein
MSIDAIRFCTRIAGMVLMRVLLIDVRNCPRILRQEARGSTQEKGGNRGEEAREVFLRKGGRKHRTMLIRENLLSRILLQREPEKARVCPDLHAAAHLRRPVQPPDKRNS